jgi:hypothetical protein
MNLSKDPSRQAMTFSSMNLHTGNPLIDSLLAMAMNPMGLMSSPGRGQSVLDAQNIRMRSRDQMELMRFGLGTSLLGQHLGGAGGLNMDGFLGQFMSPILGMPGGIMDNPMLQSINGGNPIKAIMGMKANNTGMTMGMGFGRVTDADNASVKAAFNEFQRTLFKTRTITGQDMDALINKVSQDTLPGLSDSSKQTFNQFIKKGKDGKDFFDFKAYQAQGSGLDILKQNVRDRSNALSQSLSGTDLSGTGIDANNIDIAKFEKLKKDTENFTKKIGNVMTDSALEALKKADEKTSQLRTKQSEILKAIDELSQGDKTIGEFRNQIGQQVSTGINAQTMRGYSIDQFTKAWDMSKDLGLSSLSWEDRNNKSMTLAEKMAKSAAGFARNAGGALRAVSDLTGAETAQGAMEDLNSLLGNSKANLGSEQGAVEVENLVRRFKASARTAGVGIDAVMTILNEVKALSSAHPQLQYSGGISAMETSIKSLNTTTALTAAMGSDWVRTMGGSAEVSRQVTDTLTRNKLEPVVQKSKGLVGHIANSGISDAKKKLAIDLIEKFDQGSIGGKKHNFSNEAWSQLYDQLSSITGDSAGILHRSALSVTTQQAGQIYADKNLGRDFDQAAVTATGREFELAVSLAVNADGRQVIRNGKVLTPEERKKALYEDIANRGKTGEQMSEILSRYQLANNGRLNRFIGDKHFMTNLNMYSMQQQKGYQEQLAIAKSVTENYALQEAEMGKKYAQLNQPFNQTLVQGFLNGDFGEGKQSLLDAITDGPSRTRVKEMLDAVQFNQQNKTSESFRAAMLQTMGGLENLSEEDVRKNLTLQGRGNEADAIIAQRKLLLDKNGMSQFEAVANQLTIGQLFSTNAENYSASEAAKLGISLEDVQQAQAFANGTGIIDSATKRDHANSRFNDIRGVIPMKNALIQTASLTYEDVRKDTVNLATDKLQANMQGLSDLELKNDVSQESKDAAKKRLGEELKLYHDAGYLSLKDKNGGLTLDNIDWKASKEGIGRFLEDMSSTQLSEGLKSKLTKGIGSIGSLSADEQKELLKYGGARRKEDGSIILDQKGLEALRKKQLAFNEAETAPGQVIKRASDILGEASTKKETDLQGAQKKLDQQIFEDIKTALGTGSTEIVRGLDRVAAILKAAIN